MSSDLADGSVRGALAGVPDERALLAASCAQMARPTRKAEGDADARADVAVPLDPVMGDAEGEAYRARALRDGASSQEAENVVAERRVHAVTRMPAEMLAAAPITPQRIVPQHERPALKPRRTAPRRRGAGRPARRRSNARRSDSGEPGEPPAATSHRVRTVRRTAR